MSTLVEDQSSQGSSADENPVKKSAEDYKAKMNGLSEDSAASDGGAGEPRENGIGKHKSSSSSDKHGDGHHKSSSDKHKSSSSSSKHGSSTSSSSKHKDGSSSSSSKHKDGSSSSSSKHRDGHHSSSSSSSKHRDGSSSKHSSSSSSKSKEGSSSSSHRDGKSSSSSSSSKHKDGSSSSSGKHSSSGSSSKHHSSSSSSKHRPEGSSHSSSKDKHSSSSSSDKDKHRDKSKESSSSSKDKDKHRSSSSHKSSLSSGDKHKSSSGDKHKSSSDQKHKSSSSSKSEDSKVKVKKEVINDEEADCNTSQIESPVKAIKEAPMSPVNEIQSPIKEEVKSPVKKEAVKKEITPEKKPVVKSEDEEEEEESEDEDKPLSVRINESRPKKRPKEESDYEDENEDEDEEEDDDDVPLLARAKQAKKQKIDKKPAPAPKVEVKKEVKKEKAAPKKRKVGAAEPTQTASPTKRKKKEEEEQEVWKWWEEQSEDTGVKWKYLEHKGPVFAPPYEPVAKNVKFYYEGKPMVLEQDTEEVATFYGRMLDHDYTTREVFNTNFFKDWKKIMTKEEQQKITDLKKCNFVEYNDYFKKKSEERKALSKEAKQQIKKDNEAITLEYGFCIIDHHKEKIGNFRIEPPGLFRGRGDHPKQGMLKRRVVPEDVIINCSKDSKVPQPPPGHKWKEVRHDNAVTWLASWTENIQGATKYVMLNAASKLKGQKDWQKYEVARKLHKCVDKIRANYQEDWKSKEMRVRQRAVALYFIDKLALRAGNEKDGEESADTVGCCSLRVEHITLHESKDGKSYVVEFDFLGKDSIRYQNSIPVEKRVFKNLQLFVENKSPEDDLFDRLNTTILNKHLQDLMEGLTAKVFRTYNASRTLSEQLELLTDNNDQVPAKLLSYNRANRAVAILCNHQRAVPKSFDKSMENLQKKIDNKNDDIKQVKKDIKAIKADYKQQKSVKMKTLYEKKKKTLARLEDQLVKLEVQATDKDENKEIALGTSKLNYLDPRISVAWCKKFDVPVEKVYNKTQRDKFRWALDMATEHFKF